MANGRSRILPFIRRIELVGALLVASACQQTAPASDGAVHVSPAATRAAPGQQVQFAVASPPGAEVTWRVEPPTAGTIDPSGLFTVSSAPPAGLALCTVWATLRSDPGRVGLAVVTLDVPPGVDGVSASGGRQAAADVEADSVLQEPVAGTAVSSVAGDVESRAGFFPSGSSSNP